MALTTEVDPNYQAGWFMTRYWNETGVKIRVTNDEANDQNLKALTIQLVSGNSSGATISNASGSGASIQIAIFKDEKSEEPLSNYVTVKSSPNNNLVQYADDTHTKLKHLTSGKYANTSCFFAPRLNENSRDECPNLPSAELDTVKETTYTFTLKKSLPISAKSSVTLLLFSKGKAPDNTILQVGYIEPDSAIPESNTVWLRVNGEWKKILNVRRYNQSTGQWEELPAHKKTSTGWS